MRRFKLTLALFLGAALLGCGSGGPFPIHYGSDQCDNCKMNIMDNRFGSETVTATNRVYKFDSIECMAAFNAQLGQSSEQIASLWVTDFYKPESFVSLPASQIIQTKGLRSPMGLGFAATSSDADMQKFTAEYGGTKLNWEQVTKVVLESWTTGH